MNLRTHLGAALLLATGGLGLGVPAQADTGILSDRLIERIAWCPVHERYHDHHEHHDGHVKPYWRDHRHGHHHGHTDRLERHGHRDHRRDYLDGRRHDRADRNDHHDRRSYRDGYRHDNDYGHDSRRHERASDRSRISYTDRH